jgi:hypothetical protein
VIARLESAEHRELGVRIRSRWRSGRRAREPPPGPALGQDAPMPFVHVHGGSVLLGRLAHARLPGGRLEWSEVLCDGPTPAAVDADAWYDLRAGHLAQMLPAGAHDALRERLAAQDRALAAMSVSAEIVLWFGPELFCQVLLMKLAAWLDGRATRASLVGPGDLPGRPGCSVGQMDEAELTAAFAARVPVDQATRTLARRAWDAFTDASPAALPQLLADASVDWTTLPYLGDALRRHLQERPAPEDGLAASERLVLRALAEGAPSPFVAVAAAEARPWLTDTLYAATLRRLASGNAPLVTLGAGATDAQLTPRAHEVLAGRDRWVTPPRWNGGVRIG